MDIPWQQPAWVAEAHAWIHARLGDLGRPASGPIEQPHVYPWSTVMRVPTEAGPVWFKANAPELAHEAALSELLAGLDPDLVPPLLARDPATGWMLMADAGATLRVADGESAWLAGWRDVLPRYAELQVTATDDVEQVLALGVPDLRLAGLPARYEALLDQVPAEPRFREALPAVAELCAELAAYGVPETVQHDDLHDAQIFVLGGRHRVLDWGDACVAHPFFTLAVSLEGVLAWGLHDVEGSVDVRPFRDAYLAPFEAAYGRSLAEAVPAALRLGWVCRAVNGHVVGDDRQTLTRLRMFLDGRP